MSEADEERSDARTDHRGGNAPDNTSEQIAVVRAYRWNEFPTVWAMGRGVRNFFARQRAARRVIARAGLPAEVAKLIDRVVRRTRLWSGERVEVARELIAHFEDGMEAERSAQEMIVSFGKQRMAAKLLRRAAKRNRALPWRMHAMFWRCMRWVFAGMGFIYIALTVRLFVGKPVVSHDYLADLTKEARSVPEGERAWPVYREAMIRLKPVMDEIRKDTDMKNLPKQEVDALFAAHAEDLALARKAAGMKGLGYEVSNSIHEEDRVLWPDYSKGYWSEEFEEAAKGSLFTILLPYLGDMRILAMTLRMDALRAAEAGDAERVMLDVEAMLGIAMHVRETPVFISDLVSVAVVFADVQLVQELVQKHAKLFSDMQLRDMAHELGAWDDEALRVRFESERAGYMDMIQRMYSDDGNGDGHMTIEGYRFLFSATAISRFTENRSSADQQVYVYTNLIPGANALECAAVPAMMALVPSRREAVREYEELLGMVLADTARPRWKRDSRVDSLLGSWMASPIEKIRHMPASFMFPAFENEVYQQDNNFMARDAMLTGIALELYRRRHGEWPTTLDALAPELMPKVPVDRYNGKAMRYVLREGKVVLYSVGADGDDDGGKPGVDRRGIEDRDRARWDAEWDGDIVLWEH
ncbi:MAG TPA: hypothetical protein VG711_03565 [Phycisphaerales bacterium]|nr:hypothetical protein [Phycisphaerales bacterium]